MALGTFEDAINWPVVFYHTRNSSNMLQNKKGSSTGAGSRITV